MKRLLIRPAAATLLINLGACETIKGLGKGVEDVGELVQEKAQ